MNNKIDQIENEIKIVSNSKLFISNPEIRIMQNYIINEIQ